MGKEGYVEQFKTVGDLQEAINKLIAEHRIAKKKELGVMFRVVTNLKLIGHGMTIMKDLTL